MAMMEVKHGTDLLERMRVLNKKRVGRNWKEIKGQKHGIYSQEVSGLSSMKTGGSSF